jgi:hypothetical protein
MVSNARQIELAAEAAMHGFLIDFAKECGFARDVEEDEDDDGVAFYHLSPSREDCVLAARQSITVAALLDDICNRMGVEPPAAITAALTDEPPY